MVTLRTLSAVLCASCFISVAADAQRRPMTTDDGLNMVGVNNAVMSPDGQSILFARSELKWDDNKRETTHHLVSADGGDSFQYIAKAGANAVQFSPNGTYVSFTRRVDSATQLFVMRTAGGEAIQLSKHKTNVGTYRWAPDERTIFFVAPDARSEDEEKEHKNGADAIFVDEGPNGQQAATWTNLWSLSVATREETQVTEDQSRIGSFDVSPDGHRVVYTARSENRRNQGNLSEIFLLHVATKLATRLTSNQAPENGPIWSPDGEHIVYSGVSDSDWELRLAKLWMLDPNTGNTRMISGAFEGAISRYVWTPDSRSLLFTGQQGTNSNVFRLETESGRLEAVTEETGTLRALSYSNDRTRMVYSFESLATPRDLFASTVNDFRPTRLTNANPTVTTDLTLATSEVTRWRSRDGTEIEGILVLPPDYDRSSPLPFLLHVHGGPAGSFTNSFRSNYHIWAGLGYAQLLPNVRGSGGYTDQVLRGNMEDIGGGDYWDLMTGVDNAIQMGIADPEQLGIRGWSYGGILGGWTITQTERFRGASLGAMVSDWTSEYGPGFNFDVARWYIGGTPWDDPERWRGMSPLTHAANVTTPTLLMHGINDRTDTEAQSMHFFTALKDQGKITRYIKFPREPHGFREPRHQRTRDVEEIRWIQLHVRGIDWTPWERKKDEKPPEVTSDTASS